MNLNYTHRHIHSFNSMFHRRHSVYMHARNINGIRDSLARSLARSLCLLRQRNKLRFVCYTHISKIEVFVLFAGLLEITFASHKGKLLCTWRVLDSSRGCLKLHLLYFQRINGSDAEQYGGRHFG